MAATMYDITIACKGDPAAARAMWLLISRPKKGTEDRELAFHGLAAHAEKSMGSFASTSIINPDVFFNSVSGEQARGRPEYFYPALAKTFPGLAFFIIQRGEKDSGAEVVSFEGKNGRVRLSGGWEYENPKLCEARRAWLEALQGHWLRGGEAVRETPAEAPENPPEADNADNELARAEKQTPAMCLEAVLADGEALAYVKKQSPKICLAAVEKSPSALRFVKKQTLKICRAAIKENAFALRFVHDQTKELCRAAVEQNYLAYGCVRETSLPLYRFFNEAFEKDMERIANNAD